MTFEELKAALRQRREVIARLTDLEEPTPFEDEEIRDALAPCIQPDKCKAALADLVLKGLDLRLNVGCGGAPSKGDGWLNVDARPLAGVDLCIDMGCLTAWVPPSSVIYIVSNDVVEHFGWKGEVERLFQVLLMVMKPGGELELTTPDLRTVMRRYLDAQDDGCNWLWVMYHLYGKQTYAYNFHKSMFDFPTLSTQLRAEGFKQVVHLPNRGNHLHVKAVK